MSNLFDQVPLMFQAQIGGRAQLQRIDPEKQERQEKQYSEIWVDQWIDRAYDKIPEFGADVRSRTYEFSWRFVTNSGQDPTIIRPAMGAFGLPFYPGSSMKGVFLRACKKLYPDKVELYCGSADQPGVLRFHGGYPTNDWKKQLLDITHPQQGWQVQEHDTSDKPSGESGFALISLYQPIFQFGISSNDPNFKDEDWIEVWEIWEKTLGSGLGCRTSSGYGVVSCRIDDKYPIIPDDDKILFRGKLKGQGQASKLLDVDRTPEFRHNIFRAAIRGHALRIFGGITNKVAAEKIVNDLFGSIEGNEGNVGRLAMQFQESTPLKPGVFGRHDQPTYDVEGELSWSVTRELPAQQKDTLEKLITELNRFAMLMGGFGNSWRRADHRKFYKDDYQKVIGCHWEWTDEVLLELDYNSRRKDSIFKNVIDVESFINQLLKTAKEWKDTVRQELRLKYIVNQNFANWRESWYQNNVQVWGRIAEDKDQSRAIDWLHDPYKDNKTIRQSLVTGFVGEETKIGRIWHRMYPLVIKTRELTYKNSPRYLELLTIFPNNSRKFTDFLEFLDKESKQESSFQKLWG